MSSIRVVAKTFAEHIQENKLNPQDYVFVFPNRRAGLFFRKYLAQEFEKPIIAPKITTISELFSDFSHLKKETDIALLFRLYAIYTNVIRGQNGVPEPLSDFIHWGKMMLNDFSEVDNHLVNNVDNLFANIVDLQEINKRFADYLDSAQIDAIRSFWQSFSASKPEAMHEKFLENWNLLLPLYKGLRENLFAENLAYGGMLQRDVIENFDKIPDEKFDKKYVFAGFNALSQSEEQLMLKLQEKRIADFYFDYDLPIINDPDNRASLFIKDNQIFHSKLNVEAENYQQPHVQWINVPGTIAQTYEVHKILDQLFPKTTTEEDSYANTAVILPDEALLLPLLNTIPEQIKKINVTMGYPLRATNLYAPIMYPERYFENLEQSNLDAILQALQDKLKEMQTQEESEAYFQIQSQLNVLIDLLKNQTYKDFFEAEKSPIKFFFDILQMLTLDIKISYVGDYIDGLQVMGVLESRAIEFENVIITSFNDDIYPGNSANNNSFIPFHLRKGFGLPTFERKDAIYAYNFYRLIARAKQVYFISNNQADDNQSNEPSRFLYQLKYQYRWQIEQKQVVSNAQAEQSIQNIAKNEQTLERLNELAQKGISATFLNDYIRCQFYFYWKHIQQVAEQKQDEEIFDHARIGTIFHNVMRLLYEPYINQKVDSKKVEKLQESVDDIMQKEEILPKNSNKPLTNLEKNIIQEMVQKMLKNDQQNDNFTILQLENRFEKKHTFKGKNVLMKGFIDRIDMIDDLENNQTIIRLIDYKTGKADKDIKSLDEICEDEKYKYILQTLFYCLLYEPENADFICEPHLFSVRENKKKQNETTNLILGESKNKQNIQFKPAIRDEFLQQLDRLLYEIFDQNQPFKPTDKMYDDFGSPCNSCAYWQLCKNSATAKKADL